MGWTRRRLLGAAAAVVCVGCDEAAGSSSQGVTAGESEPLPPVGSSPPDGASPDDDDVSLPGFGARVRVGPLADVLERIDSDGSAYVPEAKAWLSRYPKEAVAAAWKVYDAELHPGLEAGLVALFQKCPHLGCRVPYCVSSGWFECPCHGSEYTAVGEHRAGPGPRGLDSFAVLIDDGEVVIDTGRLVPGLPVGAMVVDQPVVGPHCVGVAER